MRDYSWYHRNTKDCKKLLETSTFQEISKPVWNGKLEIRNVPKLNEEVAETLNSLITTDKIEAIIKKLPSHKSPGAHGSQENFTKHLRNC